MPKRRVMSPSRETRVLGGRSPKRRCECQSVTAMLGCARHRQLSIPHVLVRSDDVFRTHRLFLSHRRWNNRRRFTSEMLIQYCGGSVALSATEPFGMTAA